MTTTKLEVVDEEGIDCGYYGYVFVSSVITLYKDHGDPKDVIKKVISDFNKALSSSHYKRIVNESKFMSISSKIEDVKRNLTNETDTISTIRKYSKKNDLKVDLDTSKITKYQSQLDDLKKKKNDLYQSRVELDHLDKHDDKSLDDMIKFVETLYRDSLIYNDDEVDSKLLFSTLGGSSLLYHKFISEGWKVLDSTKGCINKIDEGRFARERLISSDDLFKSSDKIDSVLG